MNSTTSSNDSYGCCSRMSRWAMTRKMSSYSCSGGTICGENGSSRNSRQLVAAGERPQVGEVQRAVEQVDVVVLQAQRLAQEHDDLDGRVVGDLQADGAAALAPPQLFLDRLQEVVGLVLVDRQVEVARHAERAAPEHAEAGEQLAGVHGDQVLEQHVREARRARRGDAVAVGRLPRPAAAAPR